MQGHATDPGVFIKSMGSRGQLGGLSAAAPQAVRALDAAGFGVICVETVGVGQAEVDIASAADTTAVLVAPGMGDSIQAAKAGVLEVADVLVVNKADRPETQRTVRDLRQMAAMSASSWQAPVVTTIAVSGEGIDELVLVGSEVKAAAEGRTRPRTSCWEIFKFSLNAGWLIPDVSLPSTGCVSGA